MSATTPLLALLPTTRKDFLDNLRCTLTILLVTHHAIIETAVTSSPSIPVAIFVTLVKSFLWSMFFFVSGYSTALSLGSRTTFLKKGLKVNLPALLYAVVGQWAFFTLLSRNWPYIFGKGDNPKAYAKLSGPVPYIILLLLFDSIALLLRKSTIPARMILNISPKSVVFLGFVTLSSYTFLNAAFIVPNARIQGFSSYLVYDTPDPSFPISHILAYIAGWQFRILKRSILSSSSRGATLGLFISLTLSSGSLYFAQMQWPPIARLLHLQISNEPQAIFVDGGINLHTLFFSLWASFSLFASPISLISLFSHMDSTSTSWGWLGKKTYVQTYLHMVPILVAEYHLRKVRNEFVKYGLVELVALSGTWLSSYIIYGLLSLITVNFRKIKRLIKW